MSHNEQSEFKICYSGEPKSTDFGLTSAEDDDSLEDIRLACVDDQDPSKFVNHRSFLRYSRELKTLTDVVRKYSKSDKVDESDLLDSILAYLTMHFNDLNTKLQGQGQFVHHLYSHVKTFQKNFNCRKNSLEMITHFISRHWLAVANQNVLLKLMSSYP